MASDLSTAAHVCAFYSATGILFMVRIRYRQDTFRAITHGRGQALSSLVMLIVGTILTFPCMARFCLWMLSLLLLWSSFHVDIIAHVFLSIFFLVVHARTHALQRTHVHLHCARYPKKVMDWNYVDKTTLFHSRYRRRGKGQIKCVWCGGNILLLLHRIDPLYDTRITTTSEFISGGGNASSEFPRCTGIWTNPCS